MSLIRYVILFILMAGLDCTAYAQGASLTPEVWDATKNTLVDGRLIYRRFNVTIAPGIKDTAHASKDLGAEALEDLRATVMKSPDTFMVIYNTGILQNCVQYKGMLTDNWNYSKLSLDDFNDAKQAYIDEGNWGILQSTYYVLKGTSRVVWALAILNSGEALFQIGKAGTQTVYYLLRYPVAGIAEGVATPVVLVGGSLWSLGASGVTTGWALPFTALIDAAHYAGDSVCPSK